MKPGLEQQTPKEIVAELDKYIIGQNKAKKAVAIALRNRLRRSMLSEELRDEIAPKNIIMIGPTGVGKTEIARRLSRFVRCPLYQSGSDQVYGSRLCGPGCGVYGSGSDGGSGFHGKNRAQRGCS